MGSSDGIAVCLIHGQNFHGRSDALLRHLKARLHREGELRRFYATHGQGGEWAGDLEGLYTAVKDLMVQLAPQWPLGEDEEEADTPF